MLRLLLLALLVPLAAHAQTPCPTTCCGFVAPADLSRFDQSTGFTAAVYVDDAAVTANRRTDAGARVAGCMGGELRGVANAQQVGGQSTYFLSVAGDPNERDAPITLHYCSAADGDIVASLAPAQNADNTPTFEANTSYGSIAIPYRMQVRSGELPVELVAFAAVADGPDVLLTWETASETNNAGFWIERAQSDETWTDLGFVSGSGTTLEAQSYRWRASHLTPGHYRFRLRQVDLDGAFEHGPIVEVDVRTMEALTLDAPGTMRAGAGTDVRFGTARGGQIRLTLYSLLGQQVAELYAGSVDAGESRSVRWSGEGQAAGLYLLVLEREGARVTRTLALVR